MSARHNLQVKNYKGISLKNIGKQIAATPIEIFQETKKQIQISLQLLRNIRNFLDEKCNNESPSFRQLFDILEDIQRITEKNIEMKNKQGIRRINNPQILDTKTDEANKIIEESVINQENTKTSSESTPTIEQAYNALNEIAVFLEKKQPQSPASTLVKIAYEIGKKSFQELLKLNIDSGVSVLNTISELYKIFHQKNEEKNPLNEFPSINKMI